MFYEMKLRDRPFGLVKSGSKRVELRLFDEKRRLLKVGDELCFVNLENGERVRRKIVALDAFEDFFALYEKFSPTDMGYEPSEQARAEDMYDYYSKEEIARYGVLAISLADIKPRR